ncbi:hypothetical protein EVAR_86159_1 [Eumeta japonica]|uniref:Uncharacterized protein n=1 Tax=Eumeta variegata TaxID=151549 RepID=A0A4C1YZH4_EUMVA|nr:hypothetical protein EVAR_86159_1 [Eumeta japonica]
MEFLTEECRENIPLDVWGWSANVGHRMILEQRAGDNGRRNETLPKLWWELNSKLRLVNTAEQDHRWCPFRKAGGHELTSCGRFYNENPDKRKAYVTQRGLCYNCLGRQNTRECDRVRPCKFYDWTLIFLYINVP